MDETEVFYRNLVDQEAEKLKSKLAGGTLFGYIIDINNINQLIYSAYLSGKIEERIYQQSIRPYWGKL